MRNLTNWLSIKLNPRHPISKDQWIRFVDTDSYIRRLFGIPVPLTEMNEGYHATLNKLDEVKNNKQ